MTAFDNDHFYRLQRSSGKVTFLHVSVILFRGGGRETSPGRQTPPTPWANTPLGTTTAVDGMHSTGMHSCKKKSGVGREGVLKDIHLLTITIRYTPSFLIIHGEGFSFVLVDY